MKKTKLSRRNLRLAKETLRLLSGPELLAANGGRGKGKKNASDGGVDTIAVSRRG